MDNVTGNERLAATIFGEDEGRCVVNADTYTLRFHDGPLAGAVITVQPLDVDSMLSMSEVERGAGMSSREWYDLASKFFLESLLEWNLHYRIRLSHGSGETVWETVPVPMTVEGMRKVTLPQFHYLYKQWMGVLAGVDEDLGKESPNGGPTPEGLPMTGL